MTVLLYTLGFLGVAALLLGTFFAGTLLGYGQGLRALDDHEQL